MRTGQYSAFLAIFVTACGSQYGEGSENVASRGEALITPATHNYPLTTTGSGAITGSETATGYSGWQGVGHWVSAFNNAVDQGGTLGFGTFAWAYSTDKTGTSWTTKQMTSFDEFGNPGPSPTNGFAFAGWRGDPGITPVIDPSLSHSGQWMIATNTCESRQAAHEFFNDDVVAALSMDGGHTWSNAAYVNAAGGTKGQSVDNPAIATNVASPYHTFVAWNNTNPTQGFLTQLNVNGTTGQLTPSGQLTIPIASGPSSIVHPQIAVGQYTTCGGATHEAVYVAYAAFGDRCNFDGTQETVPSQQWSFGLYDTVTSSWAISPEATDTQTNWPQCVGPQTGTAPTFGIDNDGRPRIAVDPNSSNFTIAYPMVSGTLGTRIEVVRGLIICSSGSTAATFNKTKDLACTPGPTCPNGVAHTKTGGGFWLQDDFAPSVAMTYSGTTLRTVVTFMSTRDDVTTPTRDAQANTYMMYSENNGGFTVPVAIGVKTIPADAIPWNQNWNGPTTTIDPDDWSDYQSIGVNYIDGTLLPVWGGDMRTGTHAIYSSLLQ
jgi:hypothetical protein